MLKWIIATASAACLAIGANAATISNLGGVDLVDGTSGTSIENATLSGGYSVDTNSVKNVTRSVYQGTSYEGNRYFSIGAGQSATLSVDPSFGSATSLSFLLGSPDSYNHITFFMGDRNVFSFVGTDVPGAYRVGMGAVYLSVSDLTFDKVVFSSDKPALELANISIEGSGPAATPTFAGLALLDEPSVPSVPVPASAVILLTGLAGLGALRRRKR